VERTRADGYTVSDDVGRLDRERVWHWITEETYWAIGRPREVMERAIDESLCFGLYAPDGTQAGFCRFVTDRATFAFLSDVFVDTAHRGTGAGTFLVETALSHPDMVAVPRHALVTDDAHGLYEKFGFTGHAPDEHRIWMGRVSPAPTS
jgi:GNAT superfamily N-acetyltransferase